MERKESISYEAFRWIVEKEICAKVIQATHKKIAFVTSW